MGETFIVIIILLGVTAILISLHIGSEYFKRERREGTRDSSKSANKLRAELEDYEGITTHSLFYRFFFRDEDKEV